MAEERTTRRYSYALNEDLLNRTEIQSLFQDLLNFSAGGETLFKVYMDGELYPESNTPYPCTIKINDNPYSLRESGAETVRIDLVCKIPLEDVSKKEYAVECLRKAVNVRNGNFTATRSGMPIEYAFISSLSLATTATPEIVNAHHVGSYRITGEMNISRKGGAILSDNVQTFIHIENGIDGIIASGDFPVVGRTTAHNWTAVVDSPVKAGKFENDTEFNSSTTAFALDVLYTDTPICRLLRDWCHGLLNNEENPFILANGKYAMEIRENYPDGVKIGNYYVISAVENKQAGAYVGLTLSLMKVPTR